jgi:O-antigen/teichoic acid export membrane protein
MPLVALFALLAATPDPDLAARFALATQPGVQFELSSGAELKPDAIAPPDCAKPTPLCDPTRKDPQRINWESAPTEVTPLATDATGLRVLVHSKRGDPLLLTAPGRVVVAFAPRGPVVRWPYFNYLLHIAACDAAGTTPPSFAQWPGSPLPNGNGRIYIAAGLAALWLLAFLLYRLARRRGREQPDAADRFFAAANASRGDPKREETWHRAGFARPLAGLLTVLAAMVILVGPYFALQSLVATRVQPFPEADGLWRTTWDALWIAWLTFDLGTQTAFVKYFAEHRVAHPKDALADVQFYVWWQIFARAAEVTVLCGLALGWLPWSRYAIYAPFVAMYGAAASVGVFGVGKLVCQAIQRFDYFNLLDMAEFKLLYFVVPIPFVLAGRAWGAAHPMYGEAFGAALGLGLGQLGTNLVMMVLGLGVLKHLGLPLGPLFIAQFDRRIVKRQVWFGIKLTLGQEPYRLTQFVEALIIVRWLADFTYWLGIRDLLYGRIYWIFLFAWGFYQSAIPAFSEAVGAGKQRLTQYYIARYFQFGFLFTAAVFSLLVAVGPTFIHGALGQQWWRASDFLVLAVAQGLLTAPAWIADSLQQGAGRPGINTVVMLIEQACRVLLLLFLIPRMQFAGIYVATLIAMTIKMVLAWSINHVRIVPLRIPPWTVIGAPIMAGVANYGVLWLAVRVFAPAQWITVLALFFAAGAISFVVTFFACGLVGGFDAAALDELRQAAEMSALVRPLCRVLAGAGRLGARLSPLPTRQLALAAEAAVEAQAIDAAASGR